MSVLRPSQKIMTPFVSTVQNQNRNNVLIKLLTTGALLFCYYCQNRQSTNMNDDDTVKAVNETELLCTRVTLLVKFLASNNARNSTRKLLQSFLVNTQQSDRHVAFLPWYSSNNKSSAVPIKRTKNVSEYFQSLQTYYPCLNLGQHTR